MNNLSNSSYDPREKMLFSWVTPTGVHSIWIRSIDEGLGIWLVNVYGEGKAESEE